jgi:hypothetical protein
MSRIEIVILLYHPHKPTDLMYTYVATRHQNAEQNNDKLTDPLKMWHSSNIWE